MNQKSLREARERIPYILQNLRVVYGVPEIETNLDPLDCLIETILSQSTTNLNSRRAFASLKQKYPSWEATRRARPAAIEAAIQSGGLAKQKSLIIKTILQQIHEQRGALDLTFLRKASPEEARQFLQQFKGVGPKTIACVLLFSCQHSLFPIDTHIFRIARRLGLIPGSGSDKAAHQQMELLIPPARYYEAHINIIRHGRAVCRPQSPRCEDCCLIDYCEYYRTV